jgi:hypothetical protein
MSGARQEKTLNARHFSGKTINATDLSALCAYDWKIAGYLDVRAALSKFHRRRSRPPVDCRHRDG